MMDQYVLSLSYGKDSLACIFAIKALGWPLDRIIHAEVWATDTIPADLPPMVEFKAKADEIIYELTGIRVEHLCATRNGEKLTYEKMFYHIPKRKPGGKFSEGSSAGFPYTKGAWCNDRLKTNPLDAVSGNGGGQSQGSHSQSEAGVRSSKTGLILGYPIRGGAMVYQRPQTQSIIKGFPLTTGVGYCKKLKNRVFQKLPCTRSENKYCAVPRHSG